MKLIKLFASVFAVLALGVAFLSGGILPFKAAASGSAVLLNVKDFGAKGDGSTDDYDALQAAAKAICAAPAGSKLVFPSGTYRIDRYLIDGGPQMNSVAPITYTNCHGVTVSGYGAKIKIKGDFYRSSDYVVGQYHFSWKRGVDPFHIVDSSDFVIEGFELDGSADQTTKAAGVMEGGNSGIVTVRSSNYFLHDLNIHHFETDGLLLGVDNHTADRNVRLENVNSHNNARQGLSIIQVRQAWVINSTFRETGLTGSYGSHDPAAGVDVEPDYGTANGMNVATGEIYFINDTFSGNVGPQLVSVAPDRVDSIYVTGATVSPSRDSGQYTFAVAPKNALIENSTFNFSNQTVLLGTWGAPVSYVQGITYRGNSFNLGTNAGLLSDNAVNPINIDLIGNSIHISASAPDSSLLWLRGLRTFAENKVFIDGSGMSSATWQQVGLLEGTKNIRDNEYRTNLAISGKYFANSYSDGAAITGETFPNAPFYTPTIYDAGWSATSTYKSGSSAMAYGGSPVISNLTAAPLSSSVIISWVTDKATDASVQYGLSTGYGSSAQGTGQTGYHAVVLSGVQPGVTYHYKVSSKDQGGNISTSGDMQFVLPAPLNPQPPVNIDAQAPAISISSPSASQSVSGSITISANATDNVGVVGVKFMIDGVAVGGESLAAPFSATVNTSLYSDGPKTISAIARDAAGNTKTASVSVNFSNTAAQPSPTPAPSPAPAPTPTPAPSPSPAPSSSLVPVIQYFVADPAKVLPGQSSSISWSVSAANTVTLNGSSVQSSGHVAVSPSQPTAYTLVASNSAGSASRSISVAVITSQPSGKKIGCPVSMFARNLAWGVNSYDTRDLQVFLNLNGYPVSLAGIGSRGFETAYFGIKTKIALAQFQAANHLVPAVGFFGPLTRNLINSQCGF